MAVIIHPPPGQLDADALWRALARLGHVVVHSLDDGSACVHISDDPSRHGPCAALSPELCQALSLALQRGRS